MAIAYQDGTFGPIGEAAKVTRQLAGHFAGAEPLAKEPAGALFGRTPDEVQAKIDRETELRALNERIEALERASGARRRGVVAVPTDDEVAKYGAKVPHA